MNLYTVYVLKSEKDGNLYIGCTSDISKRIECHNSGKVPSTKSRKPFRLIYTENYNDKYEAYNKERFYKTAVGKRSLKHKIENHCGVV